MSIDKLWYRHARLLEEDPTSAEVGFVEAEIVVAGKNAPHEHVSMDTLCNMYNDGLLVYPEQFNLLKMSGHPMKDDDGMTLMDWILVACPANASKARQFVENMRAIDRADLSMVGASQLVTLFLTEDVSFFTKYTTYFSKVVFPLYIEQELLTLSTMQSLMQFVDNHGGYDDGDDESEIETVDDFVPNLETDPDVIDFGDALVL